MKRRIEVPDQLPYPQRVRAAPLVLETAAVCEPRQS